MCPAQATTAPASDGVRAQPGPAGTSRESGRRNRKSRRRMRARRSSDESRRPRAGSSAVPADCPGRLARAAVYWRLAPWNRVWLAILASCDCQGNAPGGALFSLREGAAARLRSSEERMFRRFFRWIFRTAIVIAVLFAIVAISDYISHRVQPNSVLVVELNGSVVERGGTGLLGLLSTHQTALNELRNAIDQGAKDPKIVGLEIKVINPEMELAQAQEIVALIQSFKSHGKWTTAYIETASESGAGNLPYIVAGAADEVSLMPRGDLNLMGV